MASFWRRLTDGLGLTSPKDAAAARDAATNVLDYGAIGDGVTLDTIAIQRAIDAVAARDGGVVEIPAGRFLCGTLHLRSKVHLHLATGARLIGTPDLTQYQVPNLPAELPEAGWGQWHRALLIGEGVEDVTVSGPGQIDGNKVYDPNGEEKMRGPHTLVFVNSRRLVIRDVQFVDSANYALFLQICDQTEIHHCEFVGGWDGIHWRGSPQRWCQQIRVRHCRFHTGDDAIAGRYWDDTLIEHCTFNSACNGIRVIGPAKHLLVTRNLFYGPAERPNLTSGAERRSNMLCGVILQPGAWDATTGPLDDVQLLDNTMHHVACPFTIWSRPGNTVGRVLVQGLNASGVYRSAIAIESWAESAIDDVTLRNICVEFTGGGSLLNSAPAVAPPEVDVRALPAWAVYARQVKRLALEDVRFVALKPDGRPVLRADAVADLQLENVRYPDNKRVPQAILRLAEAPDPSSSIDPTSPPFSGERPPRT